jgi:hypothetical protein
VHTDDTPVELQDVAPDATKTVTPLGLSLIKVKPVSAKKLAMFRSTLQFMARSRKSVDQTGLSG